nr:elongin-A3-like [Meriones unguiculatus]
MEAGSSQAALQKLCDRLCTETEPHKLYKALKKLAAVPSLSERLAEIGFRQTIKILRKQQLLVPFARDLAAKWGDSSLLGPRGAQDKRAEALQLSSSRPGPSRKRSTYQTPEASDAWRESLEPAAKKIRRCRQDALRGSQEHGHACSLGACPNSDHARYPLGFPELSWDQTDRELQLAPVRVDSKTPVYSGARKPVLQQEWPEGLLLSQYLVGMWEAHCQAKEAIASHAADATEQPALQGISQAKEAFEAATAQAAQEAEHGHAGDKTETHRQTETKTQQQMEEADQPGAQASQRCPDPRRKGRPPKRTSSRRPLATKIRRCRQDALRGSQEDGPACSLGACPKSDYARYPLGVPEPSWGQTDREVQLAPVRVDSKTPVYTGARRPVLQQEWPEGLLLSQDLVGMWEAHCQAKEAIAAHAADATEQPAFQGISQAKEAFEAATAQAAQEAEHGHAGDETETNSQTETKTQQQMEEADQELRLRAVTARNWSRQAKKLQGRRQTKMVTFFIQARSPGQPEVPGSPARGPSSEAHLFPQASGHGPTRRALCTKTQAKRGPAPLMAKALRDYHNRFSHR